MSNDPFRQGQEAFINGLAREDDCPYDPETRDAIDWIAGWDFQDQKHAEEQPDEH